MIAQEKYSWHKGKDLWADYLMLYGHDSMPSQERLELLAELLDLDSNEIKKQISTYNPH